MKARRVEITVETEEVVRRRTRQHVHPPETDGAPEADTTPRRWTPTWLRHLLPYWRAPVSSHSTPDDPEAS